MWMDRINAYTNYYVGEGEAMSHRCFRILNTTAGGRWRFLIVSLIRVEYTSWHYKIYRKNTSHMSLLIY